MIMKTVLITGGTGFLGSYLVHSLLENGYQVVVLKRSTSNTWRIDDVLDKIKTYDIDICEIEGAFEDQHIDIVIHTACCYGRNNEKTSFIVNTNVMLGLKLFELCDKFNTDTFFNTDTLLQKYLNTYSLSKKHLVEWLKQLAGKTQVVNMKLEHLYGPKDDTTKFIPWVIDQLGQNKERIDLTEGKQERDFIYVTDVVSAYVKVLEQCTALPRFVEFDVGTGNLITVHQFVNEIAEQYKVLYPENTTELIFGVVPYREGEMMNVSVDTSALKAIGWMPVYTFQDGIKSIIAPH
jgi:nucleoside-diphosphate-sugar epimerase